MILFWQQFAAVFCLVLRLKLVFSAVLARLIGLSAGSFLLVILPDLMEGIYPLALRRKSPRKDCWLVYSHLHQHSVPWWCWLAVCPSLYRYETRVVSSAYAAFTSTFTSSWWIFISIYFLEKFFVILCGKVRHFGLISFHVLVLVLVWHEWVKRSVTHLARSWSDYSKGYFLVKGS